MVDVPLDDKDVLRNRDLSRKPVNLLTKEEKLELKRRFEDFVNVLRRDSSGPERHDPPAPKAVKWDPKRHGSKPAAG